MDKRRKYATEEERKEAKRAQEKAWRKAHPDRVKQYGQAKAKPTPEEITEKKRLQKEKRAAYLAQWYEDHKEERRAYMREYYKTYQRKDRKPRQIAPQ